MSRANYQNRVDAAMVCLLMNYPEARKKFKGFEHALRDTTIKKLAEYIVKSEDFNFKVFVTDFGNEIDPSDLIELKMLGSEMGEYQTYFNDIYGDYIFGQVQDYTIKLLHRKDHNYSEIRSDLVGILNNCNYQDESKRPDIKKTCLEFIQYIREGFTKSYIDYFDRSQGGVHRDSFIILAALSSSGKTSYAINIICKMLMDGKKVCFFSLEMSEFDIIQQIIANWSGINTSQMDRDITPQIEHQMSDALDRLYTHNNIWVYEGQRGIDNIIDEARFQAEKNKIDYFFVDYIQIVRSKLANPVERIDDISNKLQGLARELKKPVIALSQFNRTAVDEKPEMNKLKGSGTLEQSADIVLLMQTFNKAVDGDTSKRLINFYIPKNRKGKRDETYQEIFMPGNRRFFYQGVVNG